MTSHGRVVWSEGLFLQPQHFQQQERHLESVIDARMRSGQAYGWGFASLELDEAALRLGQVALASARGVFPDGTPFDLPAADPAPTPLAILPDVRDEVVVLALPMQRPDQPEVDVFDHDAAALPLRRKIQVYEMIDGTTAEARTVPLQLARLAPRLMLARNARDGYVSLAVAKVSECDGKIVSLDPRFVPPVLSCADQAVLSGYVRELCGLLGQRADAIARALGQPGRAGVSEVADFLLLQAVNRYAGLFGHLSRHAQLHPERLYAACVEAAAELCTFARDDRRPPDYPAYAHDALHECFPPVIRDLRQSLSLVIERGAIAIPLQERQHGVKVATVADRDLFRSAAFVLAVSARMPGEKVRARFPAQVKVGPAERLRDLVNLQLPGIGLHPLPVAPRQIPYHMGANYFELERDGDLWRQLDRSGGLALHVAGEFPELQIECWAIRA